MKFNGRDLSVKEEKSIRDMLTNRANLLDAIEGNTNEELLNMDFIINSVKNDIGVELAPYDVYQIFRTQNPNDTFTRLHEYGRKKEENVFNNTDDDKIPHTDDLVNTTMNLLNERELKKKNNKKTKRSEIEESDANRLKGIKRKKRFSNIFGTIASKFITPIDKERDYYDDLGVSKKAKSNDIEDAYLLEKDMKMSFHNPDRKTEENIESFKKTKEAYKVLKRKSNRDWDILNKVDKEEFDDETLEATLNGRLFIRKLPKRLLIMAIVLGLIGTTYHFGKDKIANYFSNLFDGDHTVTFDDKEVQAMASDLENQINTALLTENQAYNIGEDTYGEIPTLNSSIPETHTSYAPDGAVDDIVAYDGNGLPEEFYFLDANDDVQVYARAAAINDYLKASNVHSFTDDEIADAIRFINGSYTPQSVDGLYDIDENTKTILETYAIAQAQAANFAGGLVDENGVHMALGLNAFLVDNSEHKEFMDEAATLFINVLTSGDVGDDVGSKLEEKKNTCKQFFVQMAYLMENKILDANGDEFGYEGLTPGEGFIYGVMTHMAFPIIDSAIPNYAVSLKDNIKQPDLINLIVLEYYYNPQCEKDLDLSNIENELLRERLEKSVNENSFNKHLLALLDRAEFKLNYKDSKGDTKQLDLRLQ